MVTVVKLRDPLRGTPANLVVKEDDFSVQIEAPDDERFWVRVERPNSSLIVVSDLTRSGLSVERVAAAFQLAVESAAPKIVLSGLRFSDIAPSTRTPREASERAKHEAAQITRVVVPFAKVRSLAILVAEIVSRREKFDFVVGFEPR